MTLPLSAPDLFTIFNQAAQSLGSPGYSGPWANQSAATQRTWNEFHKRLGSYVTLAVTSAPKPQASRPIEDVFREFVEALSKTEEHTLYRYLNARGNRI